MTGKERSKKYYDENKEKERLRKNEYYRQKKILKGLPPPKPRKQKEPVPPSPIQPVIPSPIQPVAPSGPRPTRTGASFRHKPVVEMNSISTQTVSSSNTFSTQTEPEDEQPNDPQPEAEPEPPIQTEPDNNISAIDKITILIKALPDEKKGNIKFKLDSFKTIINILKTPLYKAFIKNITSSPVVVIKAIKEAEYKPGTKYATRSVLAYINCILFLLDKYTDIAISIPKKKLYQDQSKVIGYIADEQDAAKKEKLAETGNLPSFDEYSKKIVETYGTEGREYLITELYRETKARDNLVLKVVKSNSEVTNDDNYLIITEKPIAEVIINDYKTKDGGYEEFKVKLSKEWTTVMRNYIKN
jgi:hypothetical protein